MPIILAAWKLRSRISSFRPDWANSLQDPISKITRAKWTGGVAQAVEGLLCKHEVLSSNHSSIKKKKKGSMTWKRKRRANIEKQRTENSRTE
jgi:hypothetical protein